MNIVNYLYNHTKKYHTLILILALAILFYFVASYAYSSANISEKFTTSDVANSQEFVPGMQVYFSLQIGARTAKLQNRNGIVSNVNMMEKKSMGI